jgi:CRP-like cAMP-binding protein
MAGIKYHKNLSTVPLFSSLSNRDLQRIAKASDEVLVEEGQILVTQDTTGNECFVVIDGEAIAKRGNRKIATFGPGDHFGELALFDGGPRTATVIAQTPMKVLVLGRREFSGLLDDVPNLRHKVMAGLARRIRELDNKIYA